MRLAPACSSYSCTNSPATSGPGARSCAISVALPHDRLQRPRLSAVGRAGERAEISQNRAADDIAAVLDHLHLNRAHVVGLSMGGFRRRSSPPEAQSANFASLEAAPVANRRRVKGSSSTKSTLTCQSRSQRIWQLGKSGRLPDNYRPSRVRKAHSAILGIGLLLARSALPSPVNRALSIKVESPA
jgi:hypothetical protein